MSTAFSRNFENVIESLAEDLNVKGNARDPNSKFSEVPVSAAYLTPGDILFFKYFSEKYGHGEHVAMLIANMRSETGIYLGGKQVRKNTRVQRRYLAAVKLNNIWSETASLIVAAYMNKSLKYKKKPLNRNVIGPKPWIALVGRDNYRSYIVNNMVNVNKLNDPQQENL